MTLGVVVRVGDDAAAVSSSFVVFLSTSSLLDMSMVNFFFLVLLGDERAFQRSPNFLRLSCEVTDTELLLGGALRLVLLLMGLGGSDTMLLVSSFLGEDDEVRILRSVTRFHSGVVADPTVRGDTACRVSSRGLGGRGSVDGLGNDGVVLCGLELSACAWNPAEMPRVTTGTEEEESGNNGEEALALGVSCGGASVSVSTADLGVSADRGDIQDGLRVETRGPSCSWASTREVMDWGDGSCSGASVATVAVAGASVSSSSSLSSKSTGLVDTLRRDAVIQAGLYDCALDSMAGDRFHRLEEEEEGAGDACSSVVVVVVSSCGCGGGGASVSDSSLAGFLPSSGLAFGDDDIHEAASRSLELRLPHLVVVEDACNDLEESARCNDCGGGVLTGGGCIKDRLEPLRGKERCRDRPEDDNPSVSWLRDESWKGSTPSPG